MSHPVHDALSSIEEALKSVSDVNPTFMSAEEKSAALRDLVRADSRLTELRLRILATADDVAEETAAHDAAEWLAVQTKVRRQAMMIWRHEPRDEQSQRTRHRSRCRTG